MTIATAIVAMLHILAMLSKHSDNLQGLRLGLGAGTLRGGYGTADFGRGLSGRKLSKELPGILQPDL